MSTTNLDTCKTATPTTAAKANAWRRPRYDVSENDDGFSVRVSLPGVNRTGVDISYEDDTLRITGTRTCLAPEGWRPLHRELPQGDYRLHLRLNMDVDADKIAAHIEDGILDVSLPKAEAIKPRKIRVK